MYNVSVLSFFFGRVDTEKLAIISGVDSLVGERRVRPADSAAPAELPFCRLDYFGPADLFESLG